MSGEDSSPPTALGRVELCGQPGALGVAVGNALRLGAGPAPRRRRVADRDAEWVRVEEAIEASFRELELARDRLQHELGADAALLLDAPLLMHRDALLVDAVREQILGEGHAAEWAVHSTVDALYLQLAAAEVPYFRERAGEIRQVGQAILAQLRGGARHALPSDEVVIVAADLAPADAARLLKDADSVVAVATEAGSPTSHTALLAGAMGIPAVLGVAGLMERAREASLMIVDGLHGRVVVAPAADEEREARARGTRFRHFVTGLAERDEREDTPLHTLDSARVDVWANIDRPPEAEVAQRLGAQGVGLYRTEYLYLNHGGQPDEETQRDAYLRAASHLAGGRLVIRTFDLGAEKLLPHEASPHCPNPALGMRGVRIGLAHPPLLDTQIRAVLRAASALESGHIGLMFPMINHLGELRALRAQCDRIAGELGVATDLVEFGAMIETPAAALRVDKIAAEVDFLSVGSNDLTQYTLAVDRGNPDVAELADSLDPAVLTLLARVAEVGTREEVRVTLCGSLASDPLGVPIVLGLGYRNLSVPVATLPIVRELVRKVRVETLSHLAQEALGLAHAGEVRGHVRASLELDLGEIWAEAGLDED